MRFLKRWKWTIGLVTLSLIALGVTITAFLYGWSMLGWRNGAAVTLMIYGYTAFTKQMEEIGRGIAKLRKARK